ncbi:MAG TPA: hypothetical protein VK327_00700 [Candidatus Paceibacterota bacterium]|nr:hypothetical protein [Candidatus Paceibacterota bacterium]
MKSNLLKNVLDWVLATGVLLSIIFFVQFYFRTKELRALNITVQTQMAKFQNTRQILQYLVTETEAYNKAHPDANLARILEGVKPAPAPAATTTKAAGK